MEDQQPESGKGKTVTMRVVRYAETDNGDGNVSQEVQLSPTHRDGRPINLTLQTATVHLAEFVNPASLAANEIRGGGYVKVTIEVVEDPADAVAPTQQPAQPGGQIGSTFLGFGPGPQPVSAVPVNDSTRAQPGATVNPDTQGGNAANSQQ
jgi:hypothetical protein